MATFVHDGNVIDYTPSSDVASGAVVVQGELVGVSPRPIAANAAGVLAVAGVFDFPKATGASTAISAGANCYWDAGNHQATATASGNKLIGKSVRAAADADATVRVRLMQ
ncbi:MAG: DUF2190 family protein [Phycisphaeraceae bacterium]|nr:DUF2190 family protein [Phycisphaeraceae bacterium]